MGFPMPSVSIVIPTYNRASLIGETLESVLAQTFADWECLVVDDASTDHTRAVVEEYRARDPRIRYTAQETNEGGASARNRGAALTEGDFVAFLDNDDVWLPGFLAATVALLQAHPHAVLAAAPRLYWDGEGTLMTEVFSEQAQRQPLRTMIGHCFVVPSQCLIRRSALQKTQGLRCWPADDFDLWLQLLVQGTAVFAQEPLMKWRRHEGNFGAVSRDRLVTTLNIEILKKFLWRRDVSLWHRVVAAGNIQRKHEYLLGLELAEGSLPRSAAARLARLLLIVPSPLLRSPALARRYLRGACPGSSESVS